MSATTLPEIELLIAKLNVWQEHRDPCESGHVEHTAEDHVGSKVVKAWAGAFGADWGLDEAVAFIRSAVEIEERRSLLGPVLLARSLEGRKIAFELKPEPRP